MLIHLSTVAGTPLVSIDPEGGPIPLIESVTPEAGFRTTFRLSFPIVDDRNDPDLPSGRSARPAGLIPSVSDSPSDRPETRTQGKGRMWRYGGMSLAFASMLIIGMMISTVLHSGSSADAGSAMNGSDGIAPLSTTSAPVPPSITDRQPSPSDSGPPPIRLPYVEATPDNTAALPSQPAPSEPVPRLVPAPVPQPTVTPTPAPMPANPGALFGLHS